MSLSQIGVGADGDAFANREGRWLDGPMGCCDQEPKKPSADTASGSCCSAKEGKETESEGSGCCGSQRKFDWILWGSLILMLAGVVGHFLVSDDGPGALQVYCHGVYELIHTMWWGLLAGVIAISVMARVPREFVLSLLGRGGTFGGLLRAALAGLCLDLCNHGILMVGAKLYERGASLGQTMAFLIASPWNSLSLTLILIALIGLPWTLTVMALSLVIALFSGWIFERLVAHGILPGNPNSTQLPENFQFWSEAKSQVREVPWSLSYVGAMLWEGLGESRMILRWIFFGTVLAAMIRALVDVGVFQDWFGPTLLGLLLTLVAATVIEVCSEGSTPLAADLFTRAHAPGNGFTFLMAGAATDYTEIMVLRQVTGRWKIALFLPLVTVPQILVLGWILNQWGSSGS